MAVPLQADLLVDFFSYKKLQDMETMLIAGSTGLITDRTGVTYDVEPTSNGGLQLVYHLQGGIKSYLSISPDALGIALFARMPA